MLMTGEDSLHIICLLHDTLDDDAKVLNVQTAREENLKDVFCGASKGGACELTE